MTELKVLLIIMKIKVAPPVTTPSSDTTYRAAYVRLLLTKLKECKKTTSSQLGFSEQDKRVIEYYLKDVARKAVLEDTSREECVGIFIARIDRLVFSDKSEWERVRELVQQNRRSLISEEIDELDKLSCHFYRVKRKSTKR